LQAVNLKWHQWLAVEGSTLAYNPRITVMFHDIVNVAS